MLNEVGKEKYDHSRHLVLSDASIATAVIVIYMVNCPEHEK